MRPMPAIGKALNPVSNEDALPDWLTTGLDHIWLPYAQMKTMAPPRAAQSTIGSRIRLSDGRELIDGAGSWWTSVHGYRHPQIENAVRRQLEQMPHIMLGGLANEPAYRLAARLAEITPGDLGKTFFCESGSVSVEVAMKIAVQYWRNSQSATRTKFVSFRGGYHGDTFATMSVCDPDEGMHKYFAGALAEQYVIDLPTDDEKIEILNRTLQDNDDIAAVIVEPLLQGAGGMRIYGAETLKQLRAACDAHGVLLIFDEIFTGFGRTGAMFAADYADVVPDIMTLGKALTGGFSPLAATVASKKVYAAFHDDDAEKALMHGPTYTGHALACAAAEASLDLFESEPRLDQVAAIEQHCRETLMPLRQLLAVKDVRILGAVAAVEMFDPFDLEKLRDTFIAAGVFIRPLGQVVYITPAYTISEEELSMLTGAIVRVVTELAG